MTEADHWKTCLNAMRAAAEADSREVQRQQWYIAGASLCAIRSMYRVPGSFNAACLANGLELEAQDRTDLMWWARQTDEQRTVMEDSKATTIGSLVSTTQLRQRGKYSPYKIAAQEGLVKEYAGNSKARAAFKTKLEAALPGVDLFDVANADAVYKACIALKTQQNPASVERSITEARQTLNSDTARSRFDKAVLKVTAALEGRYAARLTELQTSYERTVRDAVEAKIASQLEQERKRANEARADAQRELNHFIARRNGLRTALTKEKWRVLASCLHSDRPDRTHEQLHKAMAIVNELEPFIERLEEA